MTAVPSTMLPLGTVAPDFTLPDTVSGEAVALAAIQSDTATVIMFICNH
ncbi:MAG: thioredoxin family protein, partial [Anaerolineales bacterium]